MPDYLGMRLLKETDKFPDEFKAWIKAQIQNPSVNFDISQLPTSIPSGRLAQNFGSAPPASPQDGTLWMLPADATNGIIWMFRWRQAAGYWEFVGGPPLSAEVVTSETTTSASYTNLTTSGPAVTLPRAGDYYVRVACKIGDNTASTTTFMSYAVGVGAAADADGVQLSQGSGTTVTYHGVHERLKTGLSATTLTAKYKTNGGTASFADRILSVLPVRVT